MDFVTFELAKKLKDKGFKQGYNIGYKKLIFSDENTIKYISDIGAYEKEYFGINIPCPFISQVLKWLREEKKVEIVASFDYEDKTWGYQVGDMTLTEYSILAYRWNFPTYEQAALAGIEYVLERLSL